MCRKRLFITLLFKVLQDDLAGAVVPIDNLSMVVSIIFSYMIFKKLSAYSLVNGVQKHGLLVQDHIGVVGNALRDNVLAFKQIDGSVIYTDILYRI